MIPCTGTAAAAAAQGEAKPAPAAVRLNLKGSGESERGGFFGESIETGEKVPRVGESGYEVSTGDNVDSDPRGRAGIRYASGTAPAEGKWYWLSGPNDSGRCDGDGSGERGAPRAKSWSGCEWD